MTRANQTALARYGFDVCRRAFAHWEAGNGASTVAIEILGKGARTSQGDAAINAGRALANLNRATPPQSPSGVSAGNLSA